MQPRFQIRVDERHVIENTPSEGLILRTTDAGHVGAGLRQLPFTDWPVVTLERISTSLDYLGLHPEPHQNLKIAMEFLHSRIDPAVNHAMLHPAEGFVASFNHGQIHARWNPPASTSTGDWTIVRPGLTPDERIDGHNITEIVPLLVPAVWNVIERTLYSTSGSMDYVDLDEAVGRLADEITAELQITELEAV